MPIDVEKLREPLAKFRKYEETKIAGYGGGLDNFIHEDEVDAMLTEIEQLRERIEKNEEALRAQAAEFERYRADFWKAYAEDEKKRQMRGDVDA